MLQTAKDTFIKMQLLIYFIIFIPAFRIKKKLEQFEKSKFKIGFCDLNFAVLEEGRSRHKC